MKELREKLIQSGFKIEKISYFNSILFPIVLIVRIFNNISGRKGEDDMNLPSPFINFILKKIFMLEMYLLRYINFPLFGVSLIAVVEK